MRISLLPAYVIKKIIRLIYTAVLLAWKLFDPEFLYAQCFQNGGQLGIDHIEIRNRIHNFVIGHILTGSFQFLGKTLTAWLEGLSNEERSDFFDSLFELLMQENASQPKDVLRFQNILAALKTIRMEESKRRMLSGVLQDLVETAKNLKNPGEEQPPQLSE